MGKKKNSQTIKTAFILSIVGNVSADALIILYAMFGILGRLSQPAFTTSFFIYCVFALAFLAAPLIFGIIAISMIKNVEPPTPKDRVFKILAKVFSIINIVGGTIILGYVLIVVWIIALIVAVFTSTSLVIF